jgi:adenylate cyclase
MSDDLSPNLDLDRLLGRIEDVVLDCPRKYTAEQAAGLAGQSIDGARQLWHSLGFADAAEDDVTYTDADVDAMRLVQQLTSLGVDDAELRSSMTRFFGQTFSRLAAMEGQIFMEFLVATPEIFGSEEGPSALAGEVLPVVEKLQNYVWRRQLASYLSRAAAAYVGDDGGTEQLTVGFADLAGFTALTRRLSEKDLGELLEVFEATAGEVVALSHGRMIKTIGDEVLFTAENAQHGAEIALQLLEAAGEADIPPLRIGLAAGPVVRRMGDVYGATVNIASRLTKLCRPGNVLVDRTVCDAIADSPRYELTPLRPAEVRGYNRLRSWRLRRKAR